MTLPDAAPSTRTPGSHRVATGAILAIAAAWLFAVNGTTSKIVLQTGEISATQLTACRSTGSALVLLVLVSATRPAALRLSRQELPLLVGYGVIGIAMCQWLYLVAIQRMPVGPALLLEFTAPIMVAVWARLVQQRRVGARLWVGLVVALAGLALVTRFWRGLTFDPVGMAAALGAAVSLATYYLMGERGQVDRDPVSLLGWAFVVSAVLWAFVAPWPDFPFDRLGTAVALPGPWSAALPLGVLVAAVVVLGTLVPFGLVVVALGRIGAPRVGLLGMMEPIGAIAVAWVVLGEALEPAQLVGATAVVAGILAVETAAIANRVRR